MEPRSVEAHRLEKRIASLMNAAKNERVIVTQIIHVRQKKASHLHAVYTTQPPCTQKVSPRSGKFGSVQLACAKDVTSLASG